MGRDKVKRGGKRKPPPPPESTPADAGNHWAGLPVNELTTVKFVPATDDERGRQQQDFLAGTVFAAGAGVAFPHSGTGIPGLSSMFVVYVEDGPQTWGPAPGLKKLFDLLDKRGAVKLHETSTVATSWSALDFPDQPLIKLKLDVLEPVEAKGFVGIVLLADQYPDAWQHIRSGGMIGITTRERMERATSRPGATFADGMEASILLGIRASSVVEMVMRSHDWPGL
jgi:hypothetical protein